MKVSIVIAAYNQQDYLPDAIESALNQTVKCEVILVNDGSPDHTREIAEKYPVRLINQVNKGLSSARNTGIMAMTGDIFLPLDSDDILYDNCIEKMLEVFNTTDADIVAPSLKCFGIGSDEIIIMKEPKLKDFRVGNRIPYCSAIKKEALLECGGYSPKMEEGWEDYHLWFDMLSRDKKIIGIQEPLVLYRTKEVSMWKESAKHSKKLYGQIFKDFPQLWPK